MVLLVMLFAEFSPVDPSVQRVLDGIDEVQIRSRCLLIILVMFFADLSPLTPSAHRVLGGKDEIQIHF